MRVVVATGNAGRVREIKQALSGLGWQLEALSGLTLPEETGSTYEENAVLKARAVVAGTGRSALADDSGLEVEALGGEPGVYSARFGGLHSDQERNRYLLDRLRDRRDDSSTGGGQISRRATFVSVVVLAHPDGEVESYRGEVSGTLLEGPRGENGFGYDPLFVPDGDTRTLAELTLAEKRAVSHRGRALDALIAAHRQGLPGGPVTGAG